MKLAQRIVVGVGVVVGLVLLGVAVYLLVDIVQGSGRVQALSNVTYRGPNGETRYGYLAVPDGPGPHPTIMLGHEWWGLTEDIVDKADLLAAEGYIAFAPNLWGETSTAAVPRAIFLVATTPQETLNAEMDAAMEYLLAVDGVDAQQLAALGFCFGGRQVMWLATRYRGLDAVVQFYGGTISDPAELGVLAENAPMLGIFGDADTILPVAEVEAFGESLTEQGIAHTFTIYPGVGHAFANGMDALNRPGPAQEAWEQTLAFLAAEVE